MTKKTDGIQSPHERGVNPWQMLGYLRGALDGNGAITPEKWDEAIEASIPTRPDAQGSPQEPCS